MTITIAQAVPLSHRHGAQAGSGKGAAPFIAPDFDETAQVSRVR